MDNVETTPTTRYVSHGRVHCTKVGHDVSVDLCWLCEGLIGFEVDHEVELVRCVPHPEHTAARSAPRPVHQG